MGLKHYLSLLRAHHYVKNLLVFTPLFFSINLFEVSLLSKLAMLFAAFSLASSFGYIINDMLDYRNDRQHKVKKKRAIASGAVGFFGAGVLAGILLAAAISLLAFLPASASMLVAAYLALSVLYSSYLKNIPVLDIFIISLFYILRVIAGGMPFGIHITPWIVFAVMFGSFVLIIGKRAGELKTSKNTRAVLKFYTAPLLDTLLTISSSLIITFYIIYSILSHGNTLFPYSSIFVAFGIFRYIYLVRSGDDRIEEPEKILFKDRYILASLIAWLIYVFAALYM